MTETKIVMDTQDTLFASAVSDIEAIFSPSFLSMVFDCSILISSPLNVDVHTESSISYLKGRKNTFFKKIFIKRRKKLDNS